MHHLDLPEPTERAVYRTVQEALTNVRKHATGAAVTVELDGDAEGLRIHVRNGPPPAATGPLLVRADSLPGGGHGLIGLRNERSYSAAASCTVTRATAGSN